MKDNRNAANLVYQPSTLAHTVTSLTHDGSKPTASTIGLVTTPARSTPVRRQHAYPTSSSKRTDPAEVAAQRALTSLELQIRSVRNELDTLKQAVQISSSTTDADLDELALKWKIAAQSAAEELFGTVKERVCRMGGAAAWRESEKKKHDRSNGLGEFAQEAEESDYADCEFDSEGEELPDDEQEYRKKEKKRAKQEMRDAAEVEVPVEEEGTRKTQVWQEGGDDDDVSLRTAAQRSQANLRHRLSPST